MSDEDPAVYDEPEYLLHEVHRVALFDQGDDGHNEIVLAGIDIVVPVEMDADGDPFHDDTVSLRCLLGFTEQIRSVGHVDVRPDPDRRLVFYRFRHVLVGAYRVAIRVGTDWVQIGGQLVVARAGVFWNGAKLDDAPPSITALEPDASGGVWWEFPSSGDGVEELSCGGLRVED